MTGNGGIGMGRERKDRNWEHKREMGLKKWVDTKKKKEEKEMGREQNG